MACESNLRKCVTFDLGHEGHLYRMSFSVHVLCGIVYFTRYECLRCVYHLTDGSLPLTHDLSYTCHIPSTFTIHKHLKECLFNTNHSRLINSSQHRPPGRVAFSVRRRYPSGVNTFQLTRNKIGPNHPSAYPPHPEVQIVSFSSLPLGKIPPCWRL